MTGELIRLMEAARCPASLLPQSAGNWTIARREIPPQLKTFFERRGDLWNSYTLLTHRLMADISDIHKADDDGFIADVVMEDSATELRKHLPIWMEAHGRVLVTGLGLGCVVRGLLAKPEVTSVDVIEIDADIIRMVGPEFARDPRVTIHHGDALAIKIPGRWDFAWHDIWTPRNEGLQVLHGQLLVNYRKRAGKQGAWAFPRAFKRRFADLLPMVGV